MSSPTTLQSGNYVQAQADSHRYHLGLGQPSPSLLPLDFVKQSSQALFSNADPLMLQYNKGGGAQSLRAHIATMLSEHRGTQVLADSLVVSGGNSQALAWVASTLSSPGDTVALENPTYFLASKILRDEGLLLHGIEMGPQGLAVDDFERDLKAGLRPKWVYCIPTHHNPTGVNLSTQHLQKLLALAQRYDMLVVFDDPYAQLHFDEAPQSALDKPVALSSGPWLRLGSFSKIFAPGMRLGWIEAPPKIQEQLLAKGFLRSGGGVNPIGGALMQEAIASGDLQRHRNLVRCELKSRHDALASAVSQYLPDLKMRPVSGGYFAWLSWPAPFAARAFARHAREQGVVFLAGDLCCVNPVAPWIHGGRVSLSFYSEQELSHAVQRLAASLKSFSEDQKA